MSTSTGASVSRPVILSGVDDLAVRSWPLRDTPWTALAALLAAIAVCTLVGLISHSYLVTILCTTALVVVLRRQWIPIDYRLGPRGVTRGIFGRQRRIPWSAIGGYEVGARGVVLLPHGANYRLRAAQGLLIPWGSQREEVLQMLEHYLDRRHASGSSITQAPSTPESDVTSLP